MGRQRGRRGVSLDLPPRDVWLFDPDADEKIPTPLDNNGFVDADELVRTVKAEVDPSFLWDKTDRTIHHLQHPGENYPFVLRGEPNPNEFYHLWSNKRRMSSLLHNFIHYVTEEPPVPPKDAMMQRILAERTLDALLRSNQSIQMLMQTRYSTEPLPEPMQASHFDRFAQRFEAARKIPKDFQIVDLDGFSLNTREDMHVINSQLGQLVLRNTISQVRDVFFQSVA